MRFSKDHQPAETTVAFLDDVRELFVQAPPAPVADDHLAAIVEATRTAESGSPDPSLTGRRTNRRRARVVAFAAAGGAALLAAVAGAAYANALPGPVQVKVARIAHHVGLSVPGNNNDVDNGDVGNSGNGRQGNNGGETRPATTDDGAQEHTGPTSGPATTDHGAQENADNGSAGDTQDGAGDTGGPTGKATRRNDAGSSDGNSGTERNQGDGGEPAPQDSANSGSDGGNG